MSISSNFAPATAFGRRNRISGRVARGIAAWWRGYTTWRSRQLAAATLQRLDDRMLPDIGIDRSEINSIVHTGGRGRSVRVGTR